MKKLFALLVCAGLFMPLALFAQDEEDNSYQMVELTYMNAKMGKSDAFEKAVKAHNEKYHKEGPHQSWLDVIVTGPHTGTYVWGMGPCMMSDLDNRPGKGAHDDDWKKNVEPHIEGYGMTEYWEFNDKLSFSTEDFEPGTSEVYAIWWLDINRGEYYRFKRLMADVQEAYAKANERTMHVYNNMFINGGGRDVALVWPRKNWTAMDEDWNLSKVFDEVHGEGSWDLMIEEWEECVKEVKREVWNSVK